MFRVTVYDEGRDPEKNEFEDWEDVETVIEDCITDLEAELIRGFSVSRIRNPWKRA